MQAKGSRIKARCFGFIFIRKAVAYTDSKDIIPLKAVKPGYVTKFATTNVRRLNFGEVDTVLPCEQIAKIDLAAFLT